MTQINLFQPQEIEVYYVLPTIRKYFTLNLKERGMPQKDIARLLGLQPSTVSQYVKNKRASNIKFSKEVEDFIQTSSSKIGTTSDMIKQTQETLHFIRESGNLCKIHRQVTKMPCRCDPHDMGCIKNRK
ncbi:helix-turn-helix domain-containing protein [Candidatus Woesearchaeota archaeon]|nr:helix-turn-helix domain-containing protein [Candidatus Woesearchaeota archaeon]